jgi:hypothetical protein
LIRVEPRPWHRSTTTETLLDLCGFPRASSLDSLVNVKSTLWSSSDWTIIRFIIDLWMDVKLLITEVMFGSPNPSTAVSTEASLVFVHQEGTKQYENGQIFDQGKCESLG